MTTDDIVRGHFRVYGLLIALYTVNSIKKEHNNTEIYLCNSEVFMNKETESYWHLTSKTKRYPQLTNDIETDTLIVGGGITGVTCAYSLAVEGASVTLIEAGGLCDGTTGNTTAKLTIQHDIIYSRLLKEQGKDAASTYAKAQDSAIEFVRGAVEKEKIDCNLVDNTAYIYAQTEEEAEKVEKEYQAALEIGIAAEFLKDTAFPRGNMCVLGFHNQSVFHPVRYVSALAEAAINRGAKIFCQTKAVQVEDGDIIKVTCENGVAIKAKHLLMATQYPIYDGMGFYFTRLYPRRDYGIAVKPNNDWPDGSYLNTSDPSRSVRKHMENGEPIMIVVGEEHFTGRSEVDMHEHFDNLVAFADEEAGVKEVIAKWSAQDYETPDGIPYIGRISANSSIYVASGFAKWGMSNGTLAGRMVSEIITHGGSRYELLFSPARADIQGSVAKFVPEVLGSVGELIKSKVEPPERFEGMQPGEGRVINFKGKRAGIYLKTDGEAVILDISCRHMRTALNFNDAEKSWDCPAHGGRYAAGDGKLLEGPPKNPLEIIFKGPYSELIAEKRR
jgi:glycine/D-amino acid oxidase-like deaminating enzyme/nitrite reductase/ring-hydroxylating ferredoxin subunit